MPADEDLIRMRYESVVVTIGIEALRGDEFSRLSAGLG
jgi:hypothetical protein